MAAPLLAIEHLRVDFPKVAAVNDVSLVVESGDVFGLIGPAGAGKTTLLRAVCGLEPRAGGAVRIDGHDSGSEPDELKRRLGFMPGGAPVYDPLSATEFLDHFARAYGVPDRARRIRDCLELMWLPDRPDALCGELSRGMKQRLLLAKTLLPDPRMLLLDEPAHGLDALERIELWKALLQLRDAGKAVLVSSRSLGELASFCNNAALLEHGSVAALGPIDAIARLIRCRRMSIKWINHEENAVRILNRAVGVRNLVREEHGATFDFDREAEALHELLCKLISENVRVTEWRNVEDAERRTRLRSGAETLQ
jgi:ABC-2 type transport system ATP-binding protein